MSDLIDGLTLGFQVFTWFIGLCFMAFWFKATGNFMRQAMSGLNPTFNRNPPSQKVAFRRFFCRHRHVSNVKDQYGRHYLACTACGHDVNHGKNKEEWR